MTAAWGYVDQPPIIPFLIHICRAVLGDSLRGIRFIPALACSLLIVQTAAIARELGGRRCALLLGAICALIAPQYLSNERLLGTNCRKRAKFGTLAQLSPELKRWR